MRVFGYTALEGYFTHATGVGKHIEQMFHGLRGPEFDFTILAARDQVGSDGLLPPEHPLAGLPLSLMPYRRKRLERRWALTGRPAVDEWTRGADWIYTPYEMNVPSRARLAATVHSLFLFDPELPNRRRFSFLAQRLRYGAVFRKVMRQADLLLTVSEFVKRQIVEWYAVRPERIVVVGNGAEPDYYQAALRPPQPPSDGKPYAVAMSGLNVLDGASYVLDVAAALLRKDKDIEIRVAGHQHEPEYLRRAEALPNIRLLGYVEKSRLASLLRDSVALLFLNRYESFGVGAIEAMAAGTPVIGTNFTAVPEVVGGAGIVADVRDPEQIADQVIELARTESLRSQYIELGRARAELFRWDCCVARLREALQAG